MAFETYRSSGRMGPLAIPLAAGAGLVAAGAGSWIYQLIVDKVPFIYLNFIATMGFGALIGAAVGYGAQRGKCRSVPVAIAIAVLCSIGGTALTYRFAYQRAMDDVIEELPLGEEFASEARELILANVTFGDYIEARVEEGWRLGRSGSGSTISGVFVYLVWLAELGVIVALAGVVALTMVRVPFHEGLDCWMPGQKVAVVSGVDPDALRIASREGNADGLLDPQAREKGGRFSAEYTAYTCEGSDHCYLSVALKWKEKRGKKEEDKTEHLVRFAKFSPTDLEKLHANVGAA